MATLRISIDALIMPVRNDRLAIVAVCLTTFMIAYAPLFGPIFILGFYALWFPLLFIGAKRIIGDPRPYYWILPFSLFACISAAWSPVAGLTIRGGLQYLTTIVCALIAARVVSVRALTIGLCIGSCAVLIYSLLFGQFSYDPLDGVYSFIGAFGSKNQLGIFASLAVLSAFGVLFAIKAGRILRAMALASGAFGTFSLYAAQSATSTITIAAAIGATTGALLLAKFSPRHRTVFFTTAVPAALVSVIIAMTSGLYGAILGVFGKDTTLTGRTYLWQRGFEIAHEQPILGIGYQGFWVQGFSRPEVLWQQFYITSRTGFHFHNTYIETMVELGYVGLFLLSTIVVGTFAGYIYRLLTATRRDDLVLFGITALFLARSFVEVDFLNQYTIGTFLVFYAAGMLAKPQRERIEAGHRVFLGRNTLSSRGFNSGAVI
ncbi:O-antigen ligase [Rhizobium sp. BE258]|uniref:O-antigen ligase family protein n=1 Tax=Rhizobium sp. BE258 TaxID=2817722 RepID=UPI002858D528|nr:O-antigen ligase [Rhizobium sp. BE258]MDR7145328.1 exopolysaccharide production protein ExoQ [Rhizobium sp. BE258]